MSGMTYVGVVLACVRAAGLLAGRSGGDGLGRALEEVAEFEGLDEVAVTQGDERLHIGERG